VTYKEPQWQAGVSSGLLIHGFIIAYVHAVWLYHTSHPSSRYEDPKEAGAAWGNDGNGPNSGRFSKGAGEGTPKTRRAAAMEVEEVDVR
jgi:hypothetical protein